MSFVPSMNRRLFVGAALAAGAGAILWTPGRDARARTPKGRVQLSYWEKWTGREGEAMQAVVDRFNQSQDRTWVHMVPVGDITAKAMVAIGGGDPPDVVGLYTYSIPGYAEARAAMPLDQFKHLGEIDPGCYLPGIRELLSHEGRLWAGVNSCYTLAMYYNRSALREIGHNPDQPPRTISELDELSARLTLQDAQGRIERAGFLPNVPGWWPYFWPCMFGGRLYEPRRGRATAADPRCVAAFEWIRDTARRLGTGPTRTFAAAFSRSIHSAQDPFISGRQAMIVQGTWLANFIRALRPDLDYACAPVPVVDHLFDPKRPTGLLEADVLVIPRGCRHPEEAYQFLLFTQRQEIQEQLATAHCKPSPFIELSPGFIESHPNRGIRIHNAIAKSQNVQILPRTRCWKEYDDLINSAFDAVWSGADPQTELASVQTHVQQLIDSAAALHRARERRLTGGAT